MRATFWWPVLIITDGVVGRSDCVSLIPQARAVFGEVTASFGVRGWRANLMADLRQGLSWDTL